MKYSHIVRGVFISRPNRFIAHVEIGGKQEIAHVKNTGRCKELLIPGATVFLQKNGNPNRKTQWSLIGVMKGENLVNIDSQAPNQVFGEWLKNSSFFKNIQRIKPEFTYGSSRFDFYVATKEEKILIEVKGVTLEENGVAMFPDAPTERGVKHVEELTQSILEGYKAYIIFIIQMSGIKYFTPNKKTHMAFADALKRAEKQGVTVLAFDCQVGEDDLEMDQPVEIRL